MFKATKHAAQVIAAREIPDEWIAHVLQHPARVEADNSDSELMHHLATIPAFEFRVLRVIYKKGSIPPLVITAFFDRSMKGKL